VYACYLPVVFLDAFAKFRKATVSFFMSFYLSVFLSVVKTQVDLKCDRDNGYFA
jgi:hypothetical protein